MNKKPKIFELILNFRFLQIIYHIGLLFIGIGFSYIYIPNTQLPNIYSTILLSIIVIISWISTVFFNDVADIEIDKISNPHRPLPKGILTIKQSLIYGFLLFITSLLLSALISKNTLILISCYHGLSWIYNMNPLRLKKIPLVATFIASCASILIIIIGFLSSFDNLINLKYIPLDFILSMLIGYTLSLPLKDLKDYTGDKYANIKTIPVLFGINKSRKIIGINLFISFLVSAILINLKSLWLLSTISGITCFLVLNLKIKLKYIAKTSSLLILIFIITFLYSAISSLILFNLF